MCSVALNESVFAPTERTTSSTSSRFSVVPFANVFSMPECATS